nr:MAG TPA: hypothetical protein [Caudoviricetes sp.]
MKKYLCSCLAHYEKRLLSKGICYNQPPVINK